MSVQIKRNSNETRKTEEWLFGLLLFFAVFFVASCGISLCGWEGTECSGLPNSPATEICMESDTCGEKELKRGGPFAACCVLDALTVLDLNLKGALCGLGYL